MAVRSEGPDRGYSWVIVVCCAYIHFALFGLFRSAGVVYVAILQNYEVSREEASWAFALCAAVFQLVGPLASLLTHYMSQRSACLLGSAVATLGIVGCYFADSVTWINISYGIIHGVGFGFVVTFVPVILNQYFIKYRASAMGLAFAGGTLSSLLFPAVMEWLLENYTLNDSFLLLSGVVMNILVASALLRPPSWLHKSHNTLAKSIDEHSDASDSGVSTSDTTNVYSKKVLNEVTKESSPITKVTANSVKVDDSQHDSLEIDDSGRTESSKNSSDPKEFDTLTSNNDSVLFDASEAKADSDSPLQKLHDRDTFNATEPEVKEPLMGKNEITVQPMNAPADKFEESCKSKRRIHHSIAYVLKQPMFHVICFTMGAYFLCVHSFFMVIVDFAKDKGIPESKGIYIISMFSLTDFFGRACLGWVSDRNYIRRKTMIGINLGFIGLLYQLYPLIDTLPGLLAVAALNGLAVGSSITLFFVLQAECLGMEVLTLVIGMTSFINGTLSLLRPGIIGLFRDVIGSYNWMFHSEGVLAVVFSIMWLAESWRSRKENLTAPKGNQDSKV